MRSNLVRILLKLLPTLTVYELKCPHTVRRCFLEFRSGDMSREDQGGRGRLLAVNNQLLKTQDEQIPRQSTI